MVADVAPWLIAQLQRQGFLVSVTWVRVSAYTSVIPAVSYLLTGLAGCSVDLGISCDARKLARTLWITKKYIYIGRSWVRVKKGPSWPIEDVCEYHLWSDQPGSCDVTFSSIPLKSKHGLLLILERLAGGAFKICTCPVINT